MPDPRKKLYDALTANNFDLGSYDEFNTKMDNPESRKKLYTAAGSNDFDLGSYDDFELKIGGKKKSNSSSVSSDQKLDSATQTGSSAGVPDMKTFEGFTDNDKKNIKRGDKIEPTINPLVKNKIKEKKISSELSKTKVTPENMYEVSAKTDELSALKKQSDNLIETDRRNKVKELETSFYDATANNDDDAVAEQRLQDAVQVNGVWNNVKNIAKNAYNTTIDVVASSSPNNLGLIKFKTNTDPLADEKKQIQIESLKNNEKLTDIEVNSRAQQLFKEKEKDNLFVDRANSFLDNLPEKDKEILKQDRALKADHLEEDNMKRLKVVSAMRTVAENKISEYKDIESQLSKLKDNNQEFPEDLYQKYQSLGTEIKNIGSELQKNEDYILNNKKDLGTAKQEFDLFKREYGDVKNFIGNIGASAAELGSGILGAVNFASSFSPNAIDRVRSLQGQQIVSDLNEGIQNDRNNLRKPVESVESAEGFMNYASDLVANQIPILLATSTGMAGLSAIGVSSTGKKFTDMNNEVLKGKANYSPLEMAVAPLLYGGAEVVSELPTMNILKKGGRIIESVAKNEASLLTKTAKTKAKEWAKDFSVDMSKEMSGEQFTNFVQNFNDKYILGKKDVNLLDNTGQVFKDTFTLTSMLKVAPHAFGAVVQPFQSKTDLGKLDENSRKIIAFSKQLNSEDLTSTERQVIQKQIETATAESSKIVANTIGKIDKMPSELYSQVVNLNTKAGEIKSQAREIADGNLSNKKQLLEGLQEEYKTLQEQRNSIIDANTSTVEILPLKEQEKLKKQALNDLTSELNPDGKKNMTITNEQILERANEIYSESKSSKEKVESENKPEIKKNEVTIPPASEDYNIVDDKKSDTQSKSTTDEKGKTTESHSKEIEEIEARRKEELEKNDASSVIPLMVDLTLPENKKILQRKELQDKINAKYDAELETLNKNKSIPKKEVESRVIEYTNGKGEKATLDTKDIDLNEKGNKFLFTENGNRLGHIEIKNQEGNEVSVSLSGIFNPSLEKKGIGTIMYQKTAEFLKEKYNKDLVSDKQRTKDSEALWAKLEREGNAIVIGDKSKGNIADYQYKYVFNEAPTKNDVSANGDFRSDSNQTGSEKKDSHVQNTTKTPTGKGEVTKKLEKINQDVFGLDKKQSKASTTIMEKTLETMAKRSGISKEELFDKITFEKGDSEITNKLSEKGKALFQIVGKNAKLAREVKMRLIIASQMESAGRSPKDIRLATGWERTGDGKWSYELNSSKAKLKVKELRSGKLGDLLNFPELYKAYPQLRNIDVNLTPKEDYRGSAMVYKNIIELNPRLLTDPKEALSTILHEVQHFVQNIEGFSKGGNPQTIRKLLEQAIDKRPFYVEKLIELKNTLFGKGKEDVKKNYKNIEIIKKFLKKNDFDLYQSIAGEVQARNVQTRQEMTAEERKNTLIYQTEDVPRKEQLEIRISSNEAMRQIAGENADLKEEIRDNLSRAVELEQKGKNPKEIWVATGWERGSDGKWRVEFDDSKMKLDEDFRSMRNYALNEAIEYKELFELYPELKDVKFSVIPRLGSMKGAFMPAKNLIMINGELSSDEVKSTLLHEIQHIIQSKEGFATGGTPKMAVDYLNSKISRLKLAKNLPSSVIKAADKLSKSLFNGIDLNESKDNFVKELNNIKDKLSEGEWDVYQSIAGEVESRNVQNRMNMTAEERKNTPLSETETKILPKEYSDDPDQHVNIGRDEQIILFQGEQGAMLAEDGKFIIYALTDPNVSTPLHEMAHVYEHYLLDGERENILEDAGHEEWTRETSEHFARGFEKYLADGIAPNPEMKSIFEDFKRWLTEIYKGITDSEIDIKLSPEMVKIYNAMLGETTPETKKFNYKNSEFTVETNEKRETKIFNKDGKEVKQYTTRKTKDGKKKVKNANYYKILAISEGNLTDNEINEANKKEIQESINNFIPSNEYEVALLEVAKGTKFSKESLEKELGNKDSNWASDQFSKKKTASIENVAEGIVAENPELNLDEQDVRNALIDVLGSYENIDSVKQQLNDSYQKSIDPYYGLSEADAIDAYEEYMTDSERSLFESVQAEDNLSDEEKLKYYQEQYEKSIESIPADDRAGIYEQFESERNDRLPNSPESNENGNSEDGTQKQDSEEKVNEKTPAEKFLDWLDEIENNLDQFGKENLSVGLPIVVAKAAIQTMRASIKAGMAVSAVIKAGLDAVKQSEWYINLNAADKIQAEKDFADSFSNPQIEKESERQTENLRKRSVSDKISEDDAYEEVSKTFEKEREELRNKKPSKEYMRDAYRNFVKRFTDRQYLSKSLLSGSGLRNTKNLIINAHGASGKAKLLFEESYDKIYKGLNRTERNTLDEIIQAKRFISIDENREERGLEPVSHPNFIDKNKSEKFLSKLEKVLGEEKYKDLEKRAGNYFKTYKDLLKQVYDNGLISKESFDSMSDVDYQPRVFLQFVTDFNGDMATAKKHNNLETGGLSSDQIKSMSEGDANSLVLNSEWLLTNSLLARQKAIAMNNINKRFMTEEFPKAKERFEKLDPKKLEGDDKRFYKYFKELSSKVIDNPLVKVTEGERSKLIKEFKKLGHDLSKLDENFRLDFPDISIEENPESKKLEISRPKYDKTPLNFQKAYYYENGQQKHFFLEQELYDSWTNNLGNFLDAKAKEVLSYATGSALVKAIATGNNPAFPIVNTPRDFLFTSTFSDQYSNFVPKAMLQVGKDAFKSFKELRNHDTSDVLKKYIEYGGAMDFLSSEGRLKKNSLVGKAIDKAVDPKIRDQAKKVFSVATLSKISEYSEMMFRLGIFQRSIKNQLSDLGLEEISEVKDKQLLDDIYNQAVTNARSILDFNQGGVVTKDLEAIVPYINVAFQGGRVAATAFEKDPVGTTSRVIQVATLASAIPVGISLALLSALKPKDDDDKSAAEIYLHAMDGISAYQKSKYMNIPFPMKNADGEYMVLKIAKAQELSPVMSITDDIYNNLLRSMVGQEKKTAGRILDDAAFTFNSNVMPLDFTSPAGFFTRTPIVKGTLTYTTGYDFFRDEPLSNDIGKVPLPVEGINNPNVEDFYKKLGEDHGLSPIRSKAFIESLITGPNTNPFVGMLYGGMDAAVSDKDLSKIGKDLAESVYKSTGKRVISYASQFNRDLAAQKDLQDKIDKINIEKYKMKAEFNQLAKDYINKDVSKDEVNKKLKELDPADRKRMVNKIKDKIRLQGIDGTILDIKYEQGNDVKALMIMHYYGDISDGSKDSKDILRQMKRAKGILTPGVIYEYKKLKKELETKKAPN